MQDATSFAAEFAADEVPCSQVDAQLFGNPPHVPELSKVHWTISTQPDVEVHAASWLEQSLHLASLQEQRSNDPAVASEPPSRAADELLALEPVPDELPALEPELLALEPVPEELLAVEPVPDELPALEPELFALEPVPEELLDEAPVELEAELAAPAAPLAELPLASAELPAFCPSSPPDALAPDDDSPAADWLAPVAPASSETVRATPSFARSPESAAQA